MLITKIRYPRNIQSTFETKSVAHMHLQALAYDPSTLENPEATQLVFKTVENHENHVSGAPNVPALTAHPLDDTRSQSSRVKNVRYIPNERELSSILTSEKSINAC